MAANISRRKHTLVYLYQTVHILPCHGQIDCVAHRHCHEIAVSAPLRLHAIGYDTTPGRMICGRPALLSPPWVIQHLNGSDREETGTNMRYAPGRSILLGARRGVVPPLPRMLTSERVRAGTRVASASRRLGRVKGLLTEDCPHPLTCEFHEDCVQ